MGCKQFKIKPNISENTKSNVSHMNTVQDISNEPEVIKTYSKVVYRNPLHLTTQLVVSSVISNLSEDSISNSKRTSLIKSNDYHNSTNSEPSKKSDQPSRLDSNTINSTSIDSKEHSISNEQNSRLHIMNSSIAFIPVSSNKSYSNDYPINSRLPHSNIVVYRHRANRFNTHQESIPNSANIESGVSSFKHHSIISARSTDSKESVKIPFKRTQATVVSSKQSNLENKLSPNETSSESEEVKLQPGKSGNLPVVDMQVMTNYLMNVLKSKSPQLRNPKFHHNEVLSETTSGTEEI
ncbi:unnamed protein product [Rotaria magnacalcarata]|uniref:Uncharacterized protein n=2 Tax=Rotaria magnacalcarata TaxID=392030 RepID=A0A815E975_9BILA|nr:unnamed protein product [Rotaria magnacalcarata]